MCCPVVRFSLLAKPFCVSQRALEFLLPSKEQTGKKFQWNVSRKEEIVNTVGFL